MSNIQRPEWFPNDAWERATDAEKQLAVEQPDAVRKFLTDKGIIATPSATAPTSPTSVTNVQARNVTRAVAQSFSAELDKDTEFVKLGMDVEAALGISNQKALRCLLLLEKHFPVVKPGEDDSKSLLRFPRPNSQDKDRTKPMFSQNAHHYHFPNPNDQTKSVNGDFYMDLAVGLSRGKELQGEIDSLKLSEKPETRGTAKPEHQGMKPNDRKSALDLARQRLNAWKNTIVTAMEVFYRRIELMEHGFQVQWYMPGGQLAGHKKCVTIAIIEPQIMSERFSVGEFRAFKPSRLNDKAFMTEHKGDKFAALIASAAKAPTPPKTKDEAKIPDVGESIDIASLLNHAWEKPDWTRLWYNRATSKTKSGAPTDEAKTLVGAWGGLYEELNAVFGPNGKPDVKAVYEQIASDLSKRHDELAKQQVAA